MKGKATKNKSSQKNKNKQKVNVVINNTPPVSASKVDEHIMSAAVAMLNPDPSTIWALPRRWPVDNCPINYRRDINISTPLGCLIQFTPDLDECLKVTSALPAPLNFTISAGRYLSEGIESVGGKWYSFEFKWYDSNSLEVQALPSFLADDPGCITVMLDGSVHLDKSLRYVGNPQSWGNENITVKRIGDVTTNLTQRARTFNAANTLVGLDPQNTPAAASGAVINNLVTLPGQEYFTLDWQTTNTVLVTALGCGLDLSVITSSTWITNSYDPAPSVGESLYRTVVQSSSKYSFPLASILATYTGSDLLNGGTVACGVVPYGFPLSRVPALAFDQIAALGTHAYVGPMKKGAHGFYIPDDVTRIAFLDTNEKVKGRSIAMAFLPQSSPSVGSESIVQLRVEIRSHIEFINASQTLCHMTCGQHCEDVVVQIMAALEAAGAQVGENPTHLKRLADAARKVAKDPKVRAMATDVLKFVGKSALKAAPLLLTAL